MLRHGPARTLAVRLHPSLGQSPQGGPVEVPLGAHETAATQWHPKIRRFFDYWQAKHPPRASTDSGGLPGRQNIDPLEIPDLLPNIWLLDVQHEPFRLRYRLVGTGIVEARGRDQTGQWLDEAHPELASDPVYLERYRSVVASGNPSWRRGPPRFWFHADFGLIENLILPLAADGTHIDMLMILTIMYWREAGDRSRAPAQPRAFRLDRAPSPTNGPK